MSRMSVDPEVRESVDLELGSPTKVSSPSEVSSFSIVNVTTTTTVSVVTGEVTTLSTTTKAMPLPPTLTTDHSINTATVPPELTPKLIETAPPELTKTKSKTENLPPAEEEEKEEVVTTTIAPTESITPPLDITKTTDIIESIPPPLEEDAVTTIAPIEGVPPPEQEKEEAVTTVAPVESVPPLEEEKEAVVTTVAPIESFVTTTKTKITRRVEEEEVVTTISPTESFSPKLETTTTSTVVLGVHTETKATTLSTVMSSVAPGSTANSTLSPHPKSTAKSTLLTDPSELTKARDDADRLNLAFKGRGCDAARVISILANRNATQRALIRQEYRSKFCEDLDGRLSKELSGDCKRAVLLWMHDSAACDATIVREALEGNSRILNSKLKIAIEVICSRTPSQIQQMKEAYGPMFGASLEQDIQDHAYGNHTIKLLLAYVGTPRSESQEVDQIVVDRDAKALYRDGEWIVGTKEETFIRIFSERSRSHLAALNFTYAAMYVNSLEKAVKKETSLNFQFALLTILRCAENPGKYFAKALYNSMRGIGTKEETLSRIIVSRAENDIQLIKEEYLNKYGNPLKDKVQSDTSGHYRSFLIFLLDPIIN